jgi:hypothetical protein
LLDARAKKTSRNSQPDKWPKGKRGATAYAVAARAVAGSAKSQKSNQKGKILHV